MLRLAFTIAVLAMFSCANGEPQIVYRDAPMIMAAASMAGASAPAPKAAPSPPAQQRPACAPRCGDRECGPDPSCGESCGTCRAGLKCSEGACISAAPLRENGETCADDSECAAHLCGTQFSSGERRCYGSKRANEACGDTYDCAAGACVERTGPSDTICIPAIERCRSKLRLTNRCTDLAIVMCQNELSCPGDVAGSTTNFNLCVEAACIVVEERKGLDCDDAINRILGGQFRCP